MPTLEMLMRDASAPMDEIKEHLAKESNPILIALEYNRIDVVDMLIASTSVADFFGNPYAPFTRVRSVAMAAHLLGLGADVNSSDMYGRTALMSNATAGDIELLQFLLANGADPNQRDHQGYTCLYSTDLSVAHIQLLLDSGANPNLVSSGASSPLCIWASDRNRSVEDRMAAVRTLVAGGANVNHIGHLQRTPLQLAHVFQQPHEMLTFLMANGASAEVTGNPTGETILMSVIKQGGLQH
jgi:ankyrin repeat protein